MDIYICIYLYTYIYVHIYVYTWLRKEKEGERENIFTKKLPKRDKIVQTLGLDAKFTKSTKIIYLRAYTKKLQKKK